MTITVTKKIVEELYINTKIDIRESIVYAFKQYFV